MKAKLIILMGLSVSAGVLIWNGDLSHSQTGDPTENAQAEPLSSVELQDAKVSAAADVSPSQVEAQVSGIKVVPETVSTSAQVTETYETESIVLWDVNSEEPATYKEKAGALKDLGKSLTEKERQVLYGYLEKGTNEDAYDLYLKDQLLIRLETQNPPAPNFLNHMMSWATDKNLDGSFRGYVVQHLRLALERKDPQSKEIEAVLLQAILDRQSDASGTALMALAEMSGSEEELKARKVAITQAALALVEDPEAHRPSKIVALQIMGDQKIHDGLDFAREEAMIGKDTTVKLAAIHAIGMLGDGADEKVLQEILNDAAKEILHPAAKRALAHIEERG